MEYPAQSENEVSGVETWQDDSQVDQTVRGVKTDKKTRLK